MEDETTKCDKIQRILKKAQNELGLKQGNESRNEEGLVKSLRKSITVRGFAKCKVIRYANTTIAKFIETFLAEKSCVKATNSTPNQEEGSPSFKFTRQPVTMPSSYFLLELMQPSSSFPESELLRSPN